MRIAVCDDEIKDRKIISETLRSTVGECSISEFDNGYELLGEPQISAVRFYYLRHHYASDKRHRHCGNA